LNVRLDSNEEIVCYQLIPEYVNNLIKPSGGNGLKITLIKDVEGISATIEENGNGFKEREVLKYQGTGLKISVP